MHLARYGPFLFSAYFRMEGLNVKTNGESAYTGTVELSPSRWGGYLSRSLFRISHALGYAPEPEQRPVCRQFERCEECPYPGHGFLCWGSESDCMRTRVEEIRERQNLG